jgi:lipoprotein-anchoring transpeptidase ErfK/SrfK
MTHRITRRRALKMIFASVAAAALSRAFHARARYPTAQASAHGEDARLAGSDLWVWMGRAIHTLTFYEEPSTRSKWQATFYRDQSFPITREVRAPFSAHNDRWYETPLGYVHSAWVLPVRVYPPQPTIDDVGAWGFWGEVSQPWTEATLEPRTNAEKVYRFYGGNVYHVVDSFVDAAGTGWYRVFDEFPMQEPPYQWVLARDVRRIPRTEMAPIHPFVGEKRIEVDLDKQRLYCYEGHRLVYTTLVASGVGIQQVEVEREGENGEKFVEVVNVDLATPTGDMAALLKQPSRHMTNRPMKPGDPWPMVEVFDLPGIPWNCFFDTAGTAIHGTYWHNDFGVKRSHGCLNVSCEAARWIYRWTYPISGYEDDFVAGSYQVGTPVKIFEKADL